MQTETISRPRVANIVKMAMPFDALQHTAGRSEKLTASRFDDIATRAHDSMPSTNNLLVAVSALISAVDCALSGESNHARQHLSAAFHSLEQEPALSESPPTAKQHASLDKCRGGLAPWQIRRVSTHIEGHLSEIIHCEDLSGLVRLSLSHFMRAFRDSFGCPPHAYLMKRRMEHAQGLMLTTNTTLGQIALECGFADQAHLSRLFQRFVGESPAAWRRARLTAANGSTKPIPRADTQRKAVAPENSSGHVYR